MRNVLPRQRFNVLKPASYPPCHGTLRPQVRFLKPLRHLAQVRSDREVFSEAWFTQSGPCQNHIPEEPGAKPNPPQPHERTLKLGKSEPSRLITECID